MSETGKDTACAENRDTNTYVFRGQESTCLCSGQVHMYVQRSRKCAHVCAEDRETPVCTEVPFAENWEPLCLSPWVAIAKPDCISGHGSGSGTLPKA